MLATNKNLQKIPLPIGCVSLGFAGLGILLQGISLCFSTLCLTISILCLSVLLLKMILIRDFLRDAVKKPVDLCILCANCMSMMLLAEYLQMLHRPSALCLWGTGVFCHVCLMILFTAKYVRHPQLAQVYGCWFLPYVGIAAAAVPSTTLGVTLLAKPLVVFSLLCFPFITIALLIRHCKKNDIEPDKQPLLSICAAPASLCLVGCLKSGLTVSTTVLCVLYVVACLLYGIALLNCGYFFYQHRKFFPSCAAFSFPFVISTTASKLMSLQDLGQICSIAGILYPVQMIIAVCLCFFVFVRMFVYVIK